jgi:hypothetical protein
MEGNASCTVAPIGAACETPVRLASWSTRCLDSLPPDLPTKTLPRQCSPATSRLEIDGRICFKDRNPPTTFHETLRVPALRQVP